MKIVILGGPGSGKKTQAGLLSDHYRLTLLTISELVKQAMAEESEPGEQLRLLHQSGQAVGDDVVLNLLQHRLSQPDLDSGFILDGFPRNLLQALTLDELLCELGMALDCVLLFEIETDALMERLVGRRTCRSCGEVYNVYTHPTVVDGVCDLCGGRLHQRADDMEETVSSRLHVYDHLTGPLLIHYGKQDKVLRIDGEGEVAEVFDCACRNIDAFLVERANRETAVEPPPIEISPVNAVAEPASEPYQPQPATESNPASAKTRPPRVAAKQAVAKKGARGQKKAVVKKTAGGKSSKVVTLTGSAKKAEAKPTSKGRVVKKSAKKVSSTKSVKAKKVVKKRAAVKKSTTSKAKAAVSAANRRAAKKQVAKKSQAKGKSPVKAKPTAKKKVAKKQTAKRSALHKPPSKQRTSKSGVKKRGPLKQ